MNHELILNKIRAARPDLHHDQINALRERGRIDFMDKSINNFVSTHTEVEIQRQIEAVRREYDKMMRYRDRLPLEVYQASLLYYIFAYEECLAEIRAQRELNEKKAKEDAEAKAKQALDEAIAKFKEEVYKILAQQASEIESLKVLLDEKNQMLIKQQIEIQNLTLEYLRLSKENKYLIGLLKSMSNPLDPILIRGTMVGDIENAKAAIRLGANIDAQDSMLEIPLHKACISNDIKMVQFLLSNGCDATIKNIVGKTAGELSSDPEIVKLICVIHRHRFT